jgi:hypothetical protein
MIKTKGNSKKNENDFIKIGIIEEWVNENTKGNQLGSFLSHHFYIYPVCESILELGLQQLLFVVEDIIFSWIYRRA